MYCSLCYIGIYIFLPQRVQHFLQCIVKYIACIIICIFLSVYEILFLGQIPQNIPEQLLQYGRVLFLTIRVHNQERILFSINEYTWSAGACHPPVVKENMIHQIRSRCSNASCGLFWWCKGVSMGTLAGLQLSASRQSYTQQTEMLCMSDTFQF